MATTRTVVGTLANNRVEVRILENIDLVVLRRGKGGADYSLLGGPADSWDCLGYLQPQYRRLNNGRVSVYWPRVRCSGMAIQQRHQAPVSTIPIAHKGLFPNILLSHSASAAGDKVWCRQ